jgi:hypothetical protein
VSEAERSPAAGSSPERGWRRDCELDALVFADAKSAAREQAAGRREGVVAGDVHWVVPEMIERLRP